MWDNVMWWGGARVLECLCACFGMMQRCCGGPFCSSSQCRLQSPEEEGERARAEAAAQRLPPGVQAVPAPSLPQGVCRCTLRTLVPCL